MNRKILYLALCVLGTLLPYSQFVPWLAQHSMNWPLFFHESFANRISSFFTLDLLVTAVVFVSFARHEASRLNIRYWWLSIVALFAVGVSLGFPLFLYLRERSLEGARGA